MEVKDMVVMSLRLTKIHMTHALESTASGHSLDNCTVDTWTVKLSACGRMRDSGVRFSVVWMFLWLRGKGVYQLCVVLGDVARS
ncbi:MAG: hypothetical protein ACKPKO_62285, partial [Candidatus Fonsibacter sp.]